MIYAPVLIPTLNRYEHLQKCLESLSKCTWADKTDVYVALDYPPSDKYVEGWKRNREFLHTCGNMGFKKIHLIERTENYGIWNPGDKGNLRCLVNEIKKQYDRYILSEDDNVFAPAFLEYMNKGLEMFKDDEDVICLSGYKFRFPEPFKYNENTFIRQCVDYNPWGIGEWTKKDQERQGLNYRWFRSQITIKNILRLRREFGLAAVGQLFNQACYSERAIIDAHMWTYIELTGKQQINPRTTLVQNIGLDGSGVTMPNSVGEDWCNPALNPMYSGNHFDFVGTGYEHFAENQKIYARGKYWKSEWDYFIILIKKIVKLLIHWNS